MLCIKILDIDFVEKSFSEDINAFDESLEKAYLFMHNSAERFSTLRVVLKTVIDEVLAQYGNDAEVKQEVVQYLLTNGEDILNETFAKFPKIP